MYYVPFERCLNGWVQKQSLRHPDRYGEDIEEVYLESPLATPLFNLCNTTLLSFLIIGDQNSGKSTFLHYLCCSGMLPPKTVQYPSIPNKTNTIPVQLSDLDFLKFGSFFPILSSTFINSRWLFNKDINMYMDEPPYLDTDVGRGLILLDRSDFEFFINEFCCEIDGTPLSHYKNTSKSSHVALQFIEMGGDHLDRLIDYHSLHSETKPVITNHPDNESQISFNNYLSNILTRSFELLEESENILYFINCHSFFIYESINIIAGINSDSLTKTLSRLNLVALHHKQQKKNGTPLNIHFFCSRLDSTVQYNTSSLKDWIKQISLTIFSSIQSIKHSNQTIGSSCDGSSVDILEDFLYKRITTGCMSNDIASISQQPFIDEWGIDEVKRLNQTILCMTQHVIFRTLQAMVDILFRTKEFDLFCGAYCLKTFNITRHHEIMSPSHHHLQKSYSLSIHGIICTLAQILKHHAIRISSLIPTSMSPSTHLLSSYPTLPGDLQYVMISLFWRFALWQRYQISIDSLPCIHVWLTRSAFSTFLDHLDDISELKTNQQQSLKEKNKKIDHTFIYNVEQYVDLTEPYQLTLPPLSIMNMWNPACTGLLKMGIVMPYVNQTYTTHISLYVKGVNPETSFELSFTPITDTQHNIVDNNEDITQGIIIRIPFSNKLFNLWIELMQHQEHKGIAVPSLQSTLHIDTELSDLIMAKDPSHKEMTLYDVFEYCHLLDSLIHSVHQLCDMDNTNNDNVLEQLFQYIFDIVWIVQSNINTINTPLIMFMSDTNHQIKKLEIIQDDNDSSSTHMMYRVIVFVDSDVERQLKTIYEDPIHWEMLQQAGTQYNLIIKGEHTSESINASSLS